jgi:hypothetical protein
MKIIDFLDAYVKVGTKLFHLTWKNKGKFKTCHRKSEEKGEFEWCTPKFLDGLNYKSKGEDIKRRRSWVHSLAHNIPGVEGHVGALRWD